MTVLRFFCFILVGVKSPPPLPSTPPASPPSPPSSPAVAKEIHVPPSATLPLHPLQSPHPSPHTHTHPIRSILRGRQTWHRARQSGHNEGVSTAQSPPESNPVLCVTHTPPPPPPPLLPSPLPDQTEIRSFTGPVSPPAPEQPLRVLCASDQRATLLLSSADFFFGQKKKLAKKNRKNTATTQIFKSTQKRISKKKSQPKLRLPPPPRFR